MVGGYKRPINSLKGNGAIQFTASSMALRAAEGSAIELNCIDILCLSKVCAKHRIELD